MTFVSASKIQNDRDQLKYCFGAAIEGGAHAGGANSVEALGRSWL